MKYAKVSERAITLGNVTIAFPTKIQTDIALGDRVVILLNNGYWAQNDPERARNVYCYGAGGKLLWRIEAPGHAWREDGIVRSYYSYLWIGYDAAKDELQADSLDWEFTIDKDTGRIVDSKLKRG